MVNNDATNKEPTVIKLTSLDTVAIKCDTNNCKSPQQQSSEKKNEAFNKDSQVKLERRIGLPSAVLMIVAVIVGSGIFVSPGHVLQKTGSQSLALAIWVLCGLLSLLGALCMAELGTAFPSSGGDYTYIGMAFGPIASFLYLWCTVLIILPCSNAIAALTFSAYALKPFYSECDPPDQSVRLLAFAMILSLAYINCKSVSASIKLQDSFTMTKVFALALVILFGIYNLLFNYSSDENKLRFDTWSNESTTSLSMLGGAFYSAFYSYAGWNALNFVTEEIKDPVKNLPRAIVVALTTVTGIYCLANIAYFSVLDKPEMVNETAIAVLFGERQFGYFAWIMPVLVGLSAASGLNALIYSSSRILFVGARQGQLFSTLNMINVHNKSPIPSLIFVTIASSLYLSSSSNIGTLIDYLTFAEAGFGTLAVSTVLVLRYKFPKKVRPFKVNIAIPIVYLTIATVMIVMPNFKDPKQALVGLAITLLGLPVFFGTVNWKQKPDAYQHMINAFNLFAQKLTMSVTPDDDGEDDDGVKNSDPINENVIVAGVNVKA